MNGNVEAVIVQGPPVAPAGFEHCGNAWLVADDIREERCHHFLRVCGGIGEPGETGNRAGKAADTLAMYLAIGRWRPSVESLGFGVRGREEKGPQHGLTDTAHLQLRGVADQADPSPRRDPGPAERSVGYLQSDRRDVAAREDVCR